VAEKIRSTEKSNDFIGNRTRDLPTCSVVLQPTTPPRAPYNYVIDSEGEHVLGEERAPGTTDYFGALFERRITPPYLFVKGTLCPQ
jgi:hypothetical protein